MTNRLAHLMAGGALTLFVLAAGCGTSGESASAGPRGVSAKSDATASFSGATDILQPGWNAIGLRGLPVTAIQGTNIAGFAYWDGTAYQTKSLTLEEVNANGGTRRGLWVFATGTGNITYSATDPSAVSLDLRAGWNLVAFPNTTPLQGPNFIARTGPNTTVPLGQVLLPQFNEIQPDRTYRQVDVTAGGSVLPGKAYWVFASQSVALSYGGSTPTPSPSPATSPSPGTSPTPVVTVSPSPGASPAASPSPAPTSSPSPSGGTLTSTFFPVTGALSEVHAISEEGRWVFGNQYDFGSNLNVPFDADLVNGVLTRDQSAFATNFGDRYFSGGSATADGSLAFIPSGNRDELARHTRSTNSGQGLGAYNSFADSPYTNASGSMVAYNTNYNSSAHACIWRASSGHAQIEDIAAVGGVGRIISYAGRQQLSDNSQVLVQDRPSSSVPGTQYLRVNLENNQVTTVFAPNTAVSSEMWLSGNGTQVLYYSGVDSATGELFVHDIDGGTPTDDRVGVSDGGAIANAPCYTQGTSTPFSSSGRFVLFYSEANNLVAGDSGSTGDYFLRDRLNRTTVRVNVDETGARLNGLVFPAMSRNAQWIVWPASGGYRRVRNPAL